jgi:hypothetical protein
MVRDGLTGSLRRINVKPKRLAMVAIRLNAGNDRNGNPRRIFVVLDGDGCFIETIEEGYAGIGALREIYPSIPESPMFETTIHEYRALLRGTK